jgi:hypothetical protein
MKKKNINISYKHEFVSKWRFVKIVKDNIAQSASSPLTAVPLLAAAP